jgi:hypothetical protein
MVTRPHRVTVVAAIGLKVIERIGRYIQKSYHE